jgi:hypothetical protein
MSSEVKRWTMFELSCEQSYGRSMPDVFVAADVHDAELAKWQFQSKVLNEVRNENFALKEQLATARAVNEKLKERLKYIVSRGYTGAEYVAREALAEIETIEKGTITVHGVEFRAEAALREGGWYLISKAQFESLKPIERKEKE